jgi:tetratricopeptide (TPR) repeat protein
LEGIAAPTELPHDEPAISTNTFEQGNVMTRAAIFVLPVVFAAITPAVEADPLENLLALPHASLVAELLGSGAADVPLLLDGNPSSAGTFDITGAPVELVFGFGDGMVAPEAVVLRFGVGGDAPRPARVDLLVSTVSPQSGFRSLRTEAVDPGAAEQRFEFRPAGARWIMVRLFPQRDAAALALGELAVAGRSGQPQTEYAFAESPARAIDILARLERDGMAPEVSSAEAEAFRRAAAGPLDSGALADVALIASGVTDGATREVYRSRIDALARTAAEALAEKKTVAEKGDALLAWLHETVLTAGYRSEQTDLSTLLDDGTFNCVSSAVIYNILALELGLDARAIEVPDHAFSIVYNGADHMDVETTTLHGFDPARERVEEFERLTGFRYIPQGNKANRREIDSAGLAALIYYNHAVEHAREGRYHQALLANFRAMSLDPEFPSAVKNALAALGNWSLELAEAGQWERAVEVAGLGAVLAPGDAGLVHNQEAVWTRWAVAEADAGRRDAAIAVLERAAVAMPEHGFDRMQAIAFTRPGEALATKGDFAGALAATDPGLKRLGPAAREELEDWRRTLYLRWANAELDVGKFEAAETVLTEALSSHADDWQLNNQLAYVAQEWTAAAASESFSDGLAVLAALDTRHPDHAGLRRVAESYVWRHVQPLADAGKMEPALEALQEARTVLAPSETTEIGAFVFDVNARAHMAEGAFEEAATLYARGLEMFPESRVLGHNSEYLAQEWLAFAHRSGGPAAAAEVVDQLSRLFPEMELERASDDEVYRRLAEHVDQGEFDEALVYREEVAAFLGEEAQVRSAEIVFDGWGRSLMDAGDWRGAAGRYADGLAVAPGSRRLAGNAAFVVQEWARAAWSDGDVPAFLDVVQASQNLFPDQPEIREAALHAVSTAVASHVRAGAFEDAITAIEQTETVLPARSAEELYTHVFDSWAKRSIDQRDWRQAIEIYDQGLERAPDSQVLKHNRAFSESQL